MKLLLVVRPGGVFLGGRVAGDGNDWFTADHAGRREEMPNKVEDFSIIIPKYYCYIMFIMQFPNFPHRVLGYLS
jgi:hypothetical protein